MTSIYTLSDPITLQIRYVGVTIRTIEIRLKAHMHWALKRNSQYHVHRWIRKIKQEPLIKIIETVPKRRSWKKAEKKWIKYYRDHGYHLTNLTDGGEGVIGLKFSEESRRKMSLSRKNKPSSMLGKHHSEETKYKLSLANKNNPKCGLHNKGRHLSEQTKLKQSIALKGHPAWNKGISPSTKTRKKISLSTKGMIRSELTREKISIGRLKYFRSHKHHMFGRHISIAQRKKMSIAAMGHPVSQETKDKISIIMKRRWKHAS